LGLLEAYRTAEAERQRREQTYALRREQKRALYDEVERLLADLKGHGTRDTETEVPARIESLQARWAEIEPLPEPEETQFRERFAKATQAVLVRYQELQRLREVEARMRDLVNQAETLCAAETPVPERQVKDLERQGQALERPADLVPDLDRRFEEALQGLRMRLQQQREQRDQALNQLKALLPDSEAAAEGGELKKAKTLLGQAQRLAKNLAGLAPDQLPSLEARLQAVSAKVHQLQDWQRWATTREKEKLCAEVEALIGSTTDPIELDRQIREARAAWKRLVTSDPGSAQVLWERFNTACTQAYQPCQAHFDEQARQRQENQAKKEALCERMERYATEADWEHMDWKALEGMLRSGRQEWNAIGPIDRKVRTELNKRFDAAMNHLAHHLAEERERNAAKKLALVERAESLVGSLSEATDLRDSIRQIKQAQAEWKAIGPAPRRQEQELWKRFRAAADAIFERRKQQAEVQQTERATRLEHKQTLCAQVEELSQLEGEGLVQAQAQVRRAQSEWETIGPTPKEATETIQRRFREACDRFFERYREHLKAVDRERLERLREKAALCTQVEALVAHANGEEARQRAEAIRERWQTLLPLEDRLERPIRERFDKAFNLVLQSDPERLAQLKQEQQANLEAKEILCIRMELLAGIESPPEAAEARLKYQVGQLSAGMKRGRGADEGSPRAQALQIEEAWYLSASIPPEKVDALERRFQRAREAFYAKEGPETHAAS
jgi:head-tail adaptor